ncbi:SAM-dependent methyltransferase [bacterium]|jgi:ribosomal protein L11 methyltransferase (prmA)|nr:SAM-dependent methyltransferase [bacterium]
MIRIKALASLVDKDSRLVDIGTDHALLPIYLYENEITKKVTGSDISSNALEFAKNNLKKHNLSDKIKLIVSDGFTNLNDEYDTAVISGMGTDTIKKILDRENLPKKLIISSHKNVDKLRLFMNKKGYKIIKEITLKDNDIYYDMIKYEKGIETLSNYDILVGKSNDTEYKLYILDKYKRIYKKSKNDKYLEYINIIERKQD